MDNSVKNDLQKDIFELLELDQSSDDEKAKIFAKMLEVVQLRVINRLGDELSEQDADELNRLIETEPESAEDFIEKKLPNYADYFKQEAEKYKNELVIKMQER